jgi:glycyl-tRNA synthetase beta chain
VPLLGDMDPAFLTLPPEVIKTSMRTHQKYFAVRDKAGKMAAKFVITSNMKASDGGAEIKRGNAKVLSARLSDGVFFWKEDNRDGNFDQWLTKLEGVTFHAKLGTMAQRVERITALAKHIAPLIGADTEVAEEAARLAKADLASYMVGEFPELQGVMGGYYADAAGLDSEVANAIREHYKPQGPSDSLPVTLSASATALADKVDTLISFFAIGEKPTGSKDPYALRRSALGVLRILRWHNMRLPIGDIFEDWDSYVVQGVKMRGMFPNSSRNNISVDNAWCTATLRSASEVKAELIDFFNDRLKVMLKDEDVPFDVLDAVFAVSDDDVVRLVAKANALQAILKTPQGDDLQAAHQRAANILAAEVKKGDLPSGAPQALPGAPAVETALLTQLNTARRAVGTALEAEKYIDALHHIAALRQGVDAFLDGVLVNADDTAIRANRLLILKAVCELSGEIADLSKIV